MAVTSPNRGTGGPALLIALIVVATGCATQSARVDEFGRFAQAGVAFADALPPVLDDSLASTVATDSLVLVKERAALSRDQRNAFLESSRADLQQRQRLLDDLRQHANLLRAYFVALDNLASTDAQSSGLTDVAQGLVSELGKLNTDIAGATIGETPLSELIGPAVNFGVVTWQAASLNRELERNAPAIERELALQRAALDSLARAMRAELEARLEKEYSERVGLPYIRDVTLPADWSERRLEALRRRLELQSVDAARQAARSLHNAFVALVEGSLGDIALGTLMTDINALLGVIERIEGE